MNLIIKFKWDPDVFHFPEHFSINFLEKKEPCLNFPLAVL